MPDRTRRPEPAGFSQSLSWVPTRADRKRRKGAYERRDAAKNRNHTGGRDSLPHYPVRHRQTHRHTGRAWDQRRRHRGVSQGSDDRDLDYPGLDPRAAAAQVLITAPGSRIAGALGDPPRAVSPAAIHSLRERMSERTREGMS